MTKNQSDPELIAADAESPSDADAVHVTVLLDRSGSMNAIADDAIGGFNRFIDEQTHLPGECRVTLVQFDNKDPHEVVLDAAPVGEVPPLTSTTYQPRGMTPLLDALGRVLTMTDRRVATHPDESQLVAVITDGHENASREFSRSDVAEMVRQRSDAGWAFVFLGANIDSFAESRAMGLQHGHAGDWAHTSEGVGLGFDAVSRSSRLWREARGPERKREMKDRLMDEVRRERRDEAS